MTNGWHPTKSTTTPTKTEAPPEKPAAKQAAQSGKVKKSDVSKAQADGSGKRQSK